MVTYPHQNARFARLYKRMADDMSVEEEEAVSSEEIETTSDATEQLNTNSGNVGAISLLFVTSNANIYNGFDIRTS